MAHHTSVEGNRRGDAFKRFLGATLGLRPKPLFIPLRLTITTLLRRNDPTCVHSQGCLKTKVQANQSARFSANKESSFYAQTFGY